METAKNISDVAAYNKAVGKLWIAFAIGFEVFALPFLSTEQNSPFVLLSVLGVVFLIIALVYSYMRILSKYQNISKIDENDRVYNALSFLYTFLYKIRLQRNVF